MTQAMQPTMSLPEFIRRRKGSIPATSGPQHFRRPSLPAPAPAPFSRLHTLATAPAAATTATCSTSPLHTPYLPASSTSPCSSHVTSTFGPIPLLNHRGHRGQMLGRRNASWIAAASKSRSKSSPDNAGGGGGEGQAGSGQRGGGGGGAVAVVERVEDTELYAETYNSYLSYAMSVIVSRAIPDVRDGLKPVHRRIVFAMHELGLVHTKPFKKCARVVGEVLGKFHPHGDSAVYDSIVRMAQSFSMREPLVDGHGNFGSLDNDPAAAMRYTECRLTPLASDVLLRDVQRETVDWAPTFDESQEEPLVLPAVVPHLLINGSAGIAVKLVGIASNIPPHNLGEVVGALRALIANPLATTEELMQYVRGPDFPTGGELLAGPELLQVYATGRGSVPLRAKASIERLGSPPGRGQGSRSQRRETTATATAESEDESPKGAAGCTSGGREQIVITELPYQVCKAELVSSLAALVESRHLEGVSDVRDESDRTGVRVVLEVKRGHNGEAILNHLYKATRLQINVHFNCMALHHSKPQLMGLKDMLQAFLDFRCQVVSRRSSAALHAATSRAHLVDGFLRLLEEPGRLDAVVAAVRGAADGPAARAALVAEHGLSEAQAEAVLGLTLRRLTGMEAAKLRQERQELSEQISRLQHILDNRSVLLGVVEAEASAVAADYPDPRRTQLLAGEELAASTSTGADAAALLPPARPCLLLASRRGFLRRLEGGAVTAQNRNTRGKSCIRLRSGDSLRCAVSCSDRHPLLLFDPSGRAFQSRAEAVLGPQAAGAPAAPTAGPSGTSVASILKLPESFPLAAVLPLPPHLEPKPRTTHTNTNKPPSDTRTASDDASVSGGEEEGQEEDEDVDTHITREDEEEQEEDGADEEAVSDNGASIVLCSRKGLIKRTNVPACRLSRVGLTMARYGSGDELGWVALVDSPKDVLVVVTAGGQALALPATGVRLSGRTSSGVMAMRLGGTRRGGDTLADVAVLPAALAHMLGSRRGLRTATEAADGANVRQDGEGSGTEPAVDIEEDEEVEEDEEAEEAVTAAVMEEEEGAVKRPAGPCLLLVTAHGVGKRVPLGQLVLGRRAQVGQKVIRLATAEKARPLKSQKAAARAAAGGGGNVVAAEKGPMGRGADRVVAALVVRDGEEVLLASRNGIMVRQAVDGICVQSRFSRGTFVMELDDDDEVVEVVAAPVAAADGVGAMA